MSAIDLPDYQKGVASAQQLLAKESLPTTSVIVGIPPNAETIVVVFECNPAAGQGLAVAFGVVSSINYPSTSTRPNSAGAQWVTFYFDVTNVIDEELAIQLDNAIGSHWYVYADTGVHVVGNFAPLVDVNGSQLVVPVIPSSGPGNHPPTELSAVYESFSANGVLLGPPGANIRYRVFALEMSDNSGLAGALTDSVSTQVMIVNLGLQAASIKLPDQGYAMSANAGINFVTLGGSGGISVVVYYTTEHI
jgi:hypothetical protein